MTLQEKEKALEPLMKKIDELDLEKQQLIEVFIWGLNLGKNLATLKPAS